MGLDTGKVFKRSVFCPPCKEDYLFTLRAIADNPELQCHLQRDTCFPVSAFGPVLLSALRRLALICLYEVIASEFPNWLRLVILTSPHVWH